MYSTVCTVMRADFYPIWLNRKSIIEVFASINSKACLQKKILLHFDSYFNTKYRINIIKAKPLRYCSFQTQSRVKLMFVRAKTHPSYAKNVNIFILFCPVVEGLSLCMKNVKWTIIQHSPETDQGKKFTRKKATFFITH